MTLPFLAGFLIVLIVGSYALALLHTWAPLAEFDDPPPLAAVWMAVFCVMAVCAVLTAAALLGLARMVELLA